MREPRRAGGRLPDVVRIFLRLGMTSFGGPAAHLGYFRREFVERQRWIDDRLFAQIVAFASILPGPTSSQVGLIIGLLRAGPAGALGAWLGFTLPSAVALAAAAALLGAARDAGPAARPELLDGALTGLTCAAVAVVAQAVVGMARTQSPDRPTRAIATGAGIVALVLAAAPTWQWVPIAAGALAGWLAGSHAQSRAMTPADGPANALRLGVPRGVAIATGSLFIVLVLIVVAASTLAARSPTGMLLATLVRAGALVFGGGHVVLPLLASLVPAGIVPAHDFYAGYGLTQAVPGPLFTFAAFVGYANRSALHGVLGAGVATIAMFLPSFLLVFAVSPVLDALRANRAAAAALRGANAAVVGMLGALVYTLVVTTVGWSVQRIALTLAVYVSIAVLRVAPAPAVLAAAFAGMLGATRIFAL